MVEVWTDNATVKGIQADGVCVFRGLVYARYERFKPSVKEPLQGAVDATRFGTLCPQRSSRLAALLGDVDGLSVAEGSLCLSIYTPDTILGQTSSVSLDGSGHPLKPVMVWIHGGAYLTGGSEDPRYGAERLVRTGDVVVVKISYRLGASGYLWDPQSGIANLGLGDQWTALEWIHENIAAFGGDPQDVTLFGQSAGAHSIQALIATFGEHCKPKALFHKAILQSSPVGITMSPRDASRIARAFRKKLAAVCSQNPAHPSSAALASPGSFEPLLASTLLQSASMEQLLDAQAAVAGMHTGMTFMPVLPDCTNVPAEASGLKVVVGYAAQDASPFVMGTLGRLGSTLVGRAVVSMVTRKLFSSAGLRYAAKLRAAGIQVETYKICWAPAGSRFGACHCIELPFILGDYEDWTSAEMLQGMTRAEFDTNSASCLHSWTAFARTGHFPPLSL